jgi:hypothetical protein
VYWFQGSPELGRFKSRIDNRWIDGGANQSQVGPSDGCGQVFKHQTGFTLAADEPDILPEPSRKTTWKKFATRRWKSIVATDSSPCKYGLAE